MNIASLHQTRFSAFQLPHTYEHGRTTMSTINEVVNTVRKLKTSKQLSLKTPLGELMLSIPDSIRTQLKVHEQLIKGVTQAATITYTSQQTETAIMEKDGSWHAIIAVTP